MTGFECSGLPLSRALNAPPPRAIDAKHLLVSLLSRCAPLASFRLAPQAKLALERFVNLERQHLLERNKALSVFAAATMVTPIGGGGGRVVQTYKYN